MASVWIRRENGQIIDALPRPMHGMTDQEEIDDQSPEYVNFLAAQRSDRDAELRVLRITGIFIRAIFNPANSGRTVEQIRAQIMQQLSG